MVRKWKRIPETDASGNSSMEFDVNSPTYMFSNTVHSYIASFHYLISYNLHAAASFKSTHAISLILLYKK